MRYAALIIAIIAGLSVLISACVPRAGVSVFTDSSQTAIGLTVLSAFLILVGGAFVIPLPRVAMVVFGIAGAVGILNGALNAGYADGVVWGIIAFVLAGMAFVGERSKRREDAAKAEDHANLARIAAGTAQTAAAPGNPNMSPDRRYWWDGASWQDANVTVPPFAQRSPDGLQWWDGTEWRQSPTASPAPPPSPSLPPSPPDEPTSS